MNKTKSVKQSFDLSDKVAVITGGAGLLGEKHAEAIAEFGGVPILLDIDEKSGIKKASRISNEYEVDCKFMLCDITDESQISSVRDSLLSKFGHIDILINNAAIDPKMQSILSGSSGSIESYNLKDLRKEIFHKYPLFQLLNRLPITNKLNFGENKKVNKRILDYTIKNFYMNDVISRASITMANCTREILNRMA